MQFLVELKWTDEVRCANWSNILKFNWPWIWSFSGDDSINKVLAVAYCSINTSSCLQWKIIALEFILFGGYPLKDGYIIQIELENILNNSGFTFNHYWQSLWQQEMGNKPLEERNRLKQILRFHKKFSQTECVILLVSVLFWNLCLILGLDAVAWSCLIAVQFTRP